MLAFTSDILAEIPQPAAPMVTQTCLMREMVRFDLDMIRSSLPKLPFLSFWQHSDTSVFPCLILLAVAIACSPATSVSSECCFSVAGYVTFSPCVSFGINSGRVGFLEG